MITLVPVVIPVTIPAELTVATPVLEEPHQPPVGLEDSMVVAPAHNVSKPVIGVGNATTVITTVE